MQNTQLKKDKLLDQAGKYVSLGKFKLALEQYLKIQELEPDETTVINMIGDIYLRLNQKDEALRYYKKLAELFEWQDKPLQAAAAYKKGLQLIPDNPDIPLRLAQLHERMGQSANAKHQYKLIAKQLLASGKYDQAVETCQKICQLDPNSSEEKLNLARTLEAAGRPTEAGQIFLACGVLLAAQDKPTQAASVVENLFRLGVQDKDLLQALFPLLRKIGLVQRGTEYLQSSGLQEGPEFQAMKIEALLLDEGNLELAQKVILESLPKNPNLYPLALKLLNECVEREQIQPCLDLVEALLGMSIEHQDESALQAALESTLQLDPSNLQLLKTLTALLIRTNNRPELEKHLKQLVILQLQQKDWREARDGLNKMVVYGQSSFYLDLLNLLNEAMMEGASEGLLQAGQRLIDALERGVWEPISKDCSEPRALGVYSLELRLEAEQDMEISGTAATGQTTTEEEIRLED
jgi:tetratricopeptide (TPR) repeat protein